MKNIFKLGLLSIIFFSVNAKASVKEVNLIFLESGETLVPSEQVESVDKNVIQLFDGRTINASEIENVEIMHSNGSLETIRRGSFKIIDVNAARLRVGGDNSGGG